MKNRLCGIITASIVACASLQYPMETKAQQHGRFHATFLQGWLCREWTAERWQLEFEAAKDAGFSAMILQSVCDLSYTPSEANTDKQDHNQYQLTNAYAMYPSDIEYLQDCTLSSQNNGDALAYAFEAAEATDMQIYLGTVNDDRWWQYGWGEPHKDNDNTPYFSQWAEENGTLCAALIAEMYERYGQEYPEQLAGFYYVNEIWNMDAACAQTDDGYYAEVIGENINASLSACRQLPLMISPFFNPDLSTAEQYGHFWKDIFKTTNFRDGDIYAPQDGGGGERSAAMIREWAMAQYDAVQTEDGLTFWLNHETFNLDGTSKSISVLRENVAATADLAQNRIVFSWNHYYNSMNRSDAADLQAEFASYALETANIPEGWLLWHSYSAYDAKDSRLFVRYPNGKTVSPEGSFIHAMNGDFGSHPYDIVFMAIDPAQDEWDLFRWNLWSGECINLTENSGYRNEDPKFSPDGLRVVFKRGQWDAALNGFRYDLAELDLRSGNVTMLTDSPAEESMPDYSDDGTTIYYSLKENETSAIYALDRTTGKSSVIFDDDSIDAYYPVAAANGLYYVRWFSASQHYDTITYYNDGTHQPLVICDGTANYSDPFPINENALFYSCDLNGSYDLCYYQDGQNVALDFASTAQQELGCSFYAAERVLPYLQQMQHYLSGLSSIDQQYDCNLDGQITAVDLSVAKQALLTS